MAEWVSHYAVPLAGVLLLAGATTTGDALNEAAGWWMVYGALVDLATLVVIISLIRRADVSYRSLLGRRGERAARPEP